MNRVMSRNKGVFALLLCLTVAIPSAYAKAKSYEEHGLDYVERGLTAGFKAGKGGWRIGDQVVSAVKNKLSWLNDVPTKMYEAKRDALIEKITKYESFQVFLAAVADNIPGILAYNRGYKLDWDLTGLNPAKAIEKVIEGDGLSSFVPKEIISTASPVGLKDPAVDGDGGARKDGEKSPTNKEPGFIAKELWHGEGKFKSVKDQYPLVPLGMKFLLSDKSFFASMSGKSAFGGAKSFCSAFIQSEKPKKTKEEPQIIEKEEPKTKKVLYRDIREDMYRNIGMSTLAGYAFKVAYNKDRSKAARLRALVGIGALQLLGLKGAYEGSEKTNYESDKIQMGIALAGLKATFDSIQAVRHETA